MSSINDSNVQSYLELLKAKNYQKADDSVETGTTNLAALIDIAKTFIEERKYEITSNLNTLSNRLIVVEGLINSIETKMEDTELEDRYDNLRSNISTLIGQSEYMDLSIGKIALLVDVYTKELKDLKREYKELQRATNYLTTQQSYYSTLDSDLTELSTKALSI